MHFFCGLRQIELVAVGKRYYGGGTKIKDPDYQFCYKGKIYEASYTDLWKLLNSEAFKIFQKALDKEIQISLTFKGLSIIVG